MREQRILDPTQQAQHAYHSTDFQGASPYRARHSNGIHPEDRPRLTDEQQRQPQPPRPVAYQYDDGTQDEEVYDTRSPSSARRYQVPVTQAPRTVVRYHRQQIPPRRSRTQEYAPPVPQRQQPQRPRGTCWWLTCAHMVAWLPGRYAVWTPPYRAV